VATNKMSRFFSIPLLAIGLLLLPSTTMAWDSVGHRLTAAVALHYLNQQQTDQLLQILTQHPRYQEDFLQRVPAFVDSSNPQQYAQWLLGQAAYWPDLARNLPASERRQYNRPAWHYIDGAWLRGAANLQGNVYLGINSFASIKGAAASSITSEDQATNVMLALDYNTRLLAEPNSAASERAVALCWVLHLIGDIHQPLHTGALFSRNLFFRGDRGGNGIAVADSNLHAQWDRALNEEGIAAALPRVLERLEDIGTSFATDTTADWSVWMFESRQLLHSSVYNSTMRQELTVADSAQRDAVEVMLEQAYIIEMQRIARDRIGLAGLRLAQWFDSALN
jgi:hypothetical protein